jgi:hypothetical protein
VVGCVEPLDKNLLETYVGELFVNCFVSVQKKKYQVFPTTRLQNTKERVMDGEEERVE